MTSQLHIPESESRTFALDVVRRLRDAGFEAVWAGGCVRDALLGIEPKDFDVATSATPEAVVALFGARRTVSVGAAFGVIMVLGQRKSQDQVEVATFRTEGKYSDGRRPDRVAFCSAEEDAQRRDFTINGMFYDPITEHVIDYVGGQTDLRQGIVRAVGVPDQRIEEDKLRMLRAVRFSARFGFVIDEATRDAVRRHAGDLNQVSVERIAQELRRMLIHKARTKAVELLKEIGLLPVVFPGLTDTGLQTALRILPQLKLAAFEPSLAALLMEHMDEAGTQASKRTATVKAECRRLKLSNEESNCTAWLVDAFSVFRQPSSLPLHELKPILAHTRRNLFLDLFNAGTVAGERQPDEQAFIDEYLRGSDPQCLNPDPLISGDDLMALGIKPGPAFSRILKQIRREQLDEIIHTHDEAIKRATALKNAE